MQVATEPELFADLFSPKQSLSAIWSCIGALADGVILTTSEGQLVGMNDEAKALYGYGPDDPMPESFGKLASRMDLYPKQPHDCYRRQETHYDKSGGKILVEITIARLNDDFKNLVLITVRDRTSLGLALGMMPENALKAALR